jgi:non-heme chloroperoxidase
VVLEKLKIENATFGGFSMGSAVTLHFVTKYNGAHIKKARRIRLNGPIVEKTRWPSLRHHRPGCCCDLIKQTKTNRQQLVAGFGKAFAGQEGGLSRNRSNGWKAST